MTQTSKLGMVDKLNDDANGYIAITLVSKQITKGMPIMLPMPPTIVANFYGGFATPTLEFKVHTIGSDAWKIPTQRNDSGVEHKILLLIPVAPGSYWLGDVDAKFYSGYLLDTQLRADYPRIFVRKGEVTYAGSIQVISVVGKNVQGEVRPGAISLNVVNDFETDMNAMAIADPGVKRLPLSNGLDRRNIKNK